jgi:hypothetical protein
LVHHPGYEWGDLGPSPSFEGGFRFQAERPEGIE